MAGAQESAPVFQGVLFLRWQAHEDGTFDTIGPQLRAKPQEVVRTPELLGGRFLMHRMSVTFSFRVASDRNDDEFDAHLDQVMDNLLDLDALDPTVGGSIAAREIEVAVDVMAQKHTKALQEAFVIIRKAIENAGGRVVDSLDEPIPAATGSQGGMVWDRRQLGVAA
jgi:hypothetical protein